MNPPLSPPSDPPDGKEKVDDGVPREVYVTSDNGILSPAEKRLVRKLDRKLLPPLTLLYLLSFLDRSNGKYYEHAWPALF